MSIYCFLFDIAAIETYAQRYLSHFPNDNSISVPLLLDGHYDDNKNIFTFLNEIYPFIIVKQ